MSLCRPVRSWRETVAKWKLLGPPQWLSGQAASTLKGGLGLGTGLPGSPRKPSPSSSSVLSGLQPRWQEPREREHREEIRALNLLLCARCQSKRFALLKLLSALLLVAPH